MGRDLKLGRFNGVDENRLAGCDVQTNKGWRNSGWTRSTGRDPVAEDLVFDRVAIEAEAALVDDLPGGLLQNQAGFGIKQIHATLIDLPEKGRMVGGRILTAEGQAESAFSIEIAVTSAQVAAGLGEDSHHVALERHGLDCTSRISAYRKPRGRDEDQAQSANRLHPEFSGQDARWAIRWAGSSINENCEDCNVVG